MPNEKVTKLTPKYIEEAKQVLANLPDEQVGSIMKFIAGQFAKEIEQGLDGELDYKDAPFFELIDRMYDEAQPKGCYFCDRSIDGNAEPFDYPNKTKICMSCMAKVANLLVAFGIDPNCIFPGIGDRKKVQGVIFEIYENVQEDLAQSRKAVKH